MKQPDAVAKLQSLFKDATPAGQLYALVGLKVKSPAEFQNAIATHKLDSKQAEVETMLGCNETSSTLSAEVQNLQAGGHDPYINATF